MRMGGLGVARKDPDFMAAYLVNHILGGGSFTSRLYDEVREKRGLVYGVSSYCCRSPHRRCSWRHADQRRPAPARRWS